MNEHYLHYLWKNKRLPMHLLKTMEGQEVKILHTGFYNTASGPDFFNGKIELDGIIHSGNIEMHLKSSDWYLHGHQYDEAYNNVILHVVYEYDKLVFIEGIPIPTVELKSLIDRQHFERTQNLVISNKPIPCAAQLKNCSELIFWHQVEAAAFNRLVRKGKELAKLNADPFADPRQVLFEAIARSFGMKTNQLPFQELAARLPFERIIRTDKKQIESIIFGAGGFLDNQPEDNFQNELAGNWSFQKAKFDIHSVNRYSWQFKGCRPQGFPTIRLAQFSSFISEMDWSEAFWELPVKEIRLRMEENLTAEPSAYWKTHYDFGKTKQKFSEGKMSLAAAQTIIINSVVPFLNWLSGKLANNIYTEKAFELMELLPAEKNIIIDNWKELGRKPKSALETQGLIELKNELCERKQCLSCKIGIELLKQ